MPPARPAFTTCLLAVLLAAQGLSAGAPTAKAAGAVQEGLVLEVPLPVIVAAVTGWVAAELGEPIPVDLPTIAFADRTTMRTLARSDGILPDADSGSDREVHALYHSDSRTIFLPDGWSGATAAQVSILVHEIVHHFQALRGDSYACPAAGERLAYDVQRRWLEVHGESLESAFGIAPLFLLIATNCLF